jgi:N-acetylglucosamine-6-phosphate deacetylase
MASLTPAEIVGVADRMGSLAAGKLADILFLDGQVNVKRVFLGAA